MSRVDEINEQIEYFAYNLITPQITEDMIKKLIELAEVKFNPNDEDPIWVKTNKYLDETLKMNNNQ